MTHKFAESTAEVLDAAFYQTPLKGDDLAQKVVRGFFLDDGFPSELGVELLNRYNHSIRWRILNETLDRDTEAKAASAARLLGRPDLKDGILKLLRENLDPHVGYKTGVGYTEAR